MQTELKKMKHENENELNIMEYDEAEWSIMEWRRKVKKWEEME